MPAERSFASLSFRDRLRYGMALLGFGTAKGILAKMAFTRRAVRSVDGGNAIDSIAVVIKPIISCTHKKKRGE
jgi:hypothetical protein